MYRKKFVIFRRYSHLFYIDLEIKVDKETRTLLSYTMECCELMDEHVDKDKDIESVTSDEDHKKVRCDNNQVVVSFKPTKKDDEEYEVELGCRQLLKGNPTATDHDNGPHPDDKDKKQKG